MTWPWLAVFVGAVFRLSWLVTADAITAPFRDWVARTWGEESQQAYLVSCLWCTSIWLAAPLAVVSGAIAGGNWWWWLLAALTGSLVTGAVGSPLWKWLNPEPPLSVEELAAEIHEAQRAAHPALGGVAWLSTPESYRAAMMAAVADLRARKVVE